MNSILRFSIFVLLITSTAFIGYSQTQKGLDIDGDSAGDEAGWAVSMPDANTVAVGARFNDSADVNAGCAKVYEWDGSFWTQKGASFLGDSLNERYGDALSMPDPNTIAIGGTRHDGGGSDAGRVQVFTWNGSSWIQKGSDLYGEAVNDYFGASVDMPDNNTLAVGATSNDGNGSSSGHVRVFAWDGSSWVQKGTDIDGEAINDKSGGSVRMGDANTIAITARNNDSNGSDSGHARIFEWNGSAWVQKGLEIVGEVAGDKMGWGLSMPNGNTVAIGSELNDGNGSNSGHVRIFDWDGTSWGQRGIDIDGESPNSRAGCAVSMPDDNTIAIGAFNGSSGLGHARIFDWNGIEWVQRSSTIDGEATSDNFGWAVSMPNPNAVAIGGRYNDANGSNAGHIRVYEIPPIALPTEPIHFEGNNDERQIVLNWSTATESNNQGFEIQRATGDQLQMGNWTSIGYVEGNGNSQQQIDYSFVDQYPESETNYYRLKQYDYDGSFVHTLVISVRLPHLPQFQVYPNPVTNDYFRVMYAGENLESAKLLILTTSGQLVKQVFLSNFKQQIEVDGLDQGTYFVQIINGKEGFMQKLIIQ